MDFRLPHSVIGQARIHCLIAGLLLGGGMVAAQPAGQVVPGARAAALGEAFVALADDGTAVYWNPACLPLLRNHEISSMRADLFGTGLISNYLSYAVPFTDRLAAGFDWLRVGFDDEELTYAQNRFALSSGYRFARWLSAGASVKWLAVDAGLKDLANPEGFSSTGTGWGFDVGFLVEPRPNFRVGVVAQDIGNARIEYENGVSQNLYPVNLRMGAAYRLRQELWLSGTVDEAAHLGAEYRLHPDLVLRGGLQRDLGESIGVGYALGTGLRYRFARMDYAYTASPGLEGTHRFSLSLAFHLTASAIKIENPELPPVFPALHKRYHQHAVGRVKLTNTGRRPLETKVSLFIPEAMDSPTERPEPLVLAPGSESVDLFALFGSQLATWVRNRMVPVEIQVSYSEGARTRRTKKQGRVTIYKRNAVQWEDIGIAAAFISPDDEVVAKFASGVLRPHSEEVQHGGQASRSLLRAMLLFDGLSAHGVRYLADPNTPYEQIAGQDFIVDSIQYPAELLQRRSGDCDDGTVLYCSLLENAGIPTAVIDAPGHILMAFDTGVDRDEAQQIGLSEDHYLVRHGHLWIPVEVTLFGKSFHEAWRTAVQECRRLEDEGRLIVVDTREAWQAYPPSAPYYEVTVTVAPPEKEILAPVFASDWEALRSVWEVFLAEEYLTELARDPGNISLRNSLVYNLLQLGEYARASTQLDTLQVRGAPTSMVLNNRAIVCILQGDLESAEIHLQRLLALHPEDEDAGANLQMVRSGRGRSPVAVGPAERPRKPDGRGEIIEIGLQDLRWKP